MGAEMEFPPPRTTGGRRSKRSGYRAEKMIEGIMAEAGFARMPLSGALGGRYSGDLRRPNDRALHVVEVKRRVGKQTTIRRWLEQGGAHLLVIDSGFGAEPLAVLNLTTLMLVLAEAGYGNALAAIAATQTQGPAPFPQPGGSDV